MAIFDVELPEILAVVFSLDGVIGFVSGFKLLLLLAGLTVFPIAVELPEILAPTEVSLPEIFALILRVSPPEIRAFTEVCPPEIFAVTLGVSLPEILAPTEVSLLEMLALTLGASSLDTLPLDEGPTGFPIGIEVPLPEMFALTLEDSSLEIPCPVDGAGLAILSPGVEPSELTGMLVEKPVFRFDGVKSIPTSSKVFCEFTLPSEPTIILAALMVPLGVIKPVAIPFPIVCTLLLPRDLVPKPKGWKLVVAIDELKN